MFKPLNSEHIVQTNEDRSTGAILSADRKYRYLLWRKIEKHWEQPVEEYEADEIWTMAFVALNPSTADGLRNDTTISKCCGFAERWGYHWMLMLNVYAYRATSPADLQAQLMPGTMDNLDYLREYTALADDTVCCWGGDIIRMDDRIFERAWDVIQRPTWCLGRTQAGYPRHPSRRAYKAELESFNRR